LAGNSGCGKTVLASYLLDYGLHFKPSNGVTVCSFFCDGKVEAQSNAKAILCSLIHQIITQNPKLIRYLDGIDDLEDVVDDFDQICQLLDAVLHDLNLGPVSIIIDAIDECEKDTRDRFLKAIKSLVSKNTLCDTLFSNEESPKPKKLQIFITSRPSLWYRHPLGREEHQNIISINDISANNKSDLELMIRTKVDDFASIQRCDSATSESLVQILYTRAEGTFLWVSLVLQMLENKATTSLEDMQNTMDKIPNGLFEIYQYYLSGIPNEHEIMARRMLHLIVGSIRLLSLNELRMLVALQPQHRTLEEVEPKMQLDPKQAVQSVLGPLIQISDDCVSLNHQSLKDFLLSEDSTLHNYAVDIPTAHLLLAEATMTYLLLDDFENTDFTWPDENDVIDDSLSESDSGLSESGSSAVESDTDFYDMFAEGMATLFRNPMLTDYETYQAVAKQHTLLDYSARHWAKHYFHATSPRTQLLQEKALKLLNVQPPKSLPFVTEQPRKTRNWFYYYWFFEQTKTHYNNDIDTFIAASYFGLLDVLQLALAKGYEPDDFTTQLAVHWASERGHSGVIKFLYPCIWNGSSDRINTSPLISAVQFNHVDLVEFLLDIGQIDPDSRSAKGSGPLAVAVTREHVEMVKLLLGDARVQCNSEDDNGETAFFKAVRQERLDILQILINDARIDVNHVDKAGRNVLYQAVSGGNVKVVKFLLNVKQLQSSHRDKSGRDALSWAAEHGELKISRLLIRSGRFKPSDKDKNGRNPISWAAASGNHELLEYLIKHDSTGVDAKDADEWTPLFWTVINHHIKCLELLLATGNVDVNSRAIYGSTPLSLAASNGTNDIIRTLLNVKEIDVLASGTDGRTALIRARNNGNWETARILEDALQRIYAD
jgi:ankyrin repeat protein